MKHNNMKFLIEIDNFYLEVSFNFRTAAFTHRLHYAEAILFHFIRVQHYAEAKCNVIQLHIILFVHRISNVTLLFRKILKDTKQSNCNIQINDL